MDLTYKRQNVYALADENELKAISEYAEGYKKFLDNGKTEREAVKETVEIIEKRGYKAYTLGDKINAGDKLYYNNRGKSLFIVRAGKADVAKTVFEFSLLTSTAPDSTSNKFRSTKKRIWRISKRTTTAASKNITGSRFRLRFTA